jgi:hypothetical protein
LERPALPGHVDLSLAWRKDKSRSEEIKVKSEEWKKK